MGERVSDQSFISALLTDVRNAIGRHGQSGSQSDKRDLVRTAFAAFEGVVWIFRQHLVAAAESTYGLTANEKSILNESSYYLAEDGHIRVQRKFASLLATVRLMARIGERIAPARTIDFSGPDWNRVQCAVAIRNRITHPKSSSDLDLTESDLQTCLSALFWFLNETTEVLDAANVAMIDYLGEVHEVFHALRTGDESMQALYSHIEDAGEGN